MESLKRGHDHFDSSQRRHHLQVMPSETCWRSGYIPEPWSEPLSSGACHHFPLQNRQTVKLSEIRTWWRYCEGSEPEFSQVPMLQGSLCSMVAWNIGIRLYSGSLPSQYHDSCRFDPMWQVGGWRAFQWSYHCQLKFVSSTTLNWMPLSSFRFWNES